VEQQVLLIYAGTNGFLDAFPVPEIAEYEKELYKFVETRHPGILVTLREQKKIDDELKGKIEGALKEFGEQFAAARTVAA
jgi:F-type H+-transporting ATPase subunit alpha